MVTRCVIAFCAICINVLRDKELAPMIVSFATTQMETIDGTPTLEEDCVSAQ